MNKINLQIKKNNIVKIFNIIQEFEPLSRRDIERISGLSWGTVSAVCTDLIKVGYINTYKETVTQMGRTPERLVINRENNLVLGIDINIIGLSFVVSNLSGNIIESSHEKLVSTKKEDIINQLLLRISQLFSTYHEFLNINISMQGQVDTENGVSISVEQFLDWQNVNLAEIIKNEFNTPVYLYHDPDCLMYYNLIKRKENLSRSENILLLKLDESIGMSLVLGGEIYKKETEIAHINVVLDGKVCKCGKKGCLDLYSSLAGLNDLYNEKFGTNYLVSDYISLLEKEEAKAVSLLQENIKYIGIALSNLINILNIKTICLEGIMMNHAKLFMNHLKKVIFENTHNEITLIVNQYLSEAPALGASLKTINQNLEQIIFSKKVLLDGEVKH